MKQVLDIKHAPKALFIVFMSKDKSEKFYLTGNGWFNGLVGKIKDLIGNIVGWIELVANVALRVGLRVIMGALELTKPIIELIFVTFKVAFLTICSSRWPNKV